MLEMNKVFMVTDINKKNNTIMKTLEERITHLQKEIETRIINGDFEVLQVAENKSPGYFNAIHISIDGIYFRFSVSEKKTYLSQHDGPVIIRWDEYEIGELKHLYGPIEDQELESKQKQLKQLQDEIREIQAK